MKLPYLAPVFRGLTAPPFRGLPAVLWLYFVFCFLLHPASQILRGNLADPDDYMYLAQVSDWLGGQGWFDNIQHRLDPPHGTLIHFARLVELPYAVTMLLLRPLLGLTGAGLVTAALWPLAWLGLFFAALNWAAKPFTGADWSRITAFAALFSPALMFQFTPGHIDHHGLQALIITLVLGCAARMTGAPPRIAWPLCGGLGLAFAELIGLEILPCLILLLVWLGLAAMVEGGRVARAAFLFVLAFAVAAAGFLVTVRLPARYLFPDPVNFSFVYVIFGFGAAVCFAGIALCARAPRVLRFAAGTGLALVTGALFLNRFPALATGPFGAMEPDIAALFLTNIAEAKPVIAAGAGTALFSLCGGLLAFAAALYFTRRARSGERWLWGLLSFLTGGCLLLAAIYQTRFLGFAQLFGTIPLARLLRDGLAYARGRRLWAAQIGLVLLIGPLPGVLLPALADGRSFNTGVLLFPVQQAENPCDVKVLAQMLDLPSGYGSRPRLIMSSINEGSELLFRTPHQVLSAPYHTDIAGNRDAVQFFSARDPAAAEGIARHRGVELVTLCKSVADVYRAMPSNHVSFDEDGKLRPGADASLAEQLADGHTPPWLKRISFPLLGNMMLFEVLPKKPGMIK